MTTTPSAADNPPLFSVVIATYNYGHLIERTIKSLSAQSCQDFELIVVDDGSTDDTRQRLSFHERPLRYFFQDNRGQSAACNLGISKANGRFIYILDSDDELLPEALEFFSQAIARDGEAATSNLYYGGYVSVSESGTERVRVSRDAPSTNAASLRAFLNKKLIGLKHGGFTLPREAFEKIRYAEDVRQGTDIVIIGQALAFYKPVNIGKIVLRSHEHPQRVRKQLDRILSASMRPVEALFDPTVMSSDLMRLKPLYAGRRLRSIARQLYLNGHYQAALEHYQAALRTSPSSMMDLGSIAKMLKALVKARQTNSRPTP